MVLLVKLQHPFCIGHNLVSLLENVKTTFSDLARKVATTASSQTYTSSYFSFLLGNHGNKHSLLLDCITQGQQSVMEFHERYKEVYMWHKSFESLIQSVLILPNQKQCRSLSLICRNLLTFTDSQY